MLSKMPSCMSRQHPKRFENQAGTRPRKWVNSNSRRRAALGLTAAQEFGPGLPGRKPDDRHTGGGQRPTDRLTD